MSYKTLVILFVALMGTLASATFSNRCPNPTASCSTVAVSRASAVATGGSSCSVRSISNAYCGTFVSELQGCFVADSLYENGACRSVRPRVDAKCFATVAAAAVASAFVRAECTDGSIGCGAANSAADAEVVACYTANSIIELATTLGTNTAECESAVVQAVDAMAQAAASAEAAACSTSGVLGLDADFEFEKSVRRIISAAFKQCWIYCDVAPADASPPPPPPASASPKSPPASPSPPPPPPPQNTRAGDPQAFVDVSASAQGDITSVTAEAEITPGGK